MEWLVAGSILLLYLMQFWSVFGRKSEPARGHRRPPNDPGVYSQRPQRPSPRPWGVHRHVGVRASQILQRPSRVNWRKEGF